MIIAVKILIIVKYEKIIILKKVNIQLFLLFIYFFINIL